MLETTTSNNWSRLHKMLICGVIPIEYKDREKECKELIKKIKFYKPNVILNQFTPPGIVLTPKECKKMISRHETVNEEYGIDLTPWLKLAINLNINLIGINIDLNLIKNIKDPKKRYAAIETVLYQNILKQYKESDFDKRIAVIVSDIHLRYFSDTLYGDSSILIKNFINDEDILIIRPDERQRIIENSFDYSFKFSKIYKTKKNRKYSETYAYSDIFFSIKGNGKSIKIGKIEYMTGIFNRYKIRDNKYIEFENDKNPVFIFLHIEDYYDLFDLYKYIIKSYMQEIYKKAHLISVNLYFVTSNEEADIFRKMNFDEILEYKSYFPEEKKEKITCFKINKEGVQNG